MADNCSQEIPNNEDYSPQFLSSVSSKAIPVSAWSSADFLLGAGVIIIQPTTGRVVLLRRKEKVKGENGIEKDEFIHFLPKGRKDLRETLEENALREGYEETGYKCTLLPLNIPTHAPSPPRDLGEENTESTEFATTSRYPNTEPFYVSTFHYKGETCCDPKYPRPNGLQYICFWYLAQISDDAVEEQGTRTAFESGYETLLLPFKEAVELMTSSNNEYVDWTHRTVMKMAWRIWEDRCTCG